jgi:hypothetical protein
VTKITKPQVPYTDTISFSKGPPTETSKTTNTELHRNETIITDCIAITMHNIENDRNVSSVMFGFYIV